LAHLRGLALDDVRKLDMPTQRRKYRRVNAAEQLVRSEPEPLTWAEICTRYPDQFVCLVDVVPIEPRSPEIRTAQIVGYGPTRRAAFDPIRNTRKYSRWSVVFTGECTKPLRRPTLILDDEALKSLSS
jgi:hypothetical protein